MKRFSLILNISLILLLAIALGYTISERYFFSSLIAVLLLAGTAISIYRSQQKHIRRMEHMIASIHYGDLNISFLTDRKGRGGDKLTVLMNEALDNFRERLYLSIMTEAETEAWQKLIRVLTHEIMNSIAPIISLSETMAERAQCKDISEKDYALMREAMISIHRRSKGLLEFVENYRKITRIPNPIRDFFSVQELFQGIRGILPPSDVPVSYAVSPDDMRIYADRSMIEQVLINLIKNATEACEGVVSPQVKVEASYLQGKVVISVSDNGQGIVPEAIDRLFVPFFTTKPGGSGIGLSLSRQIMNRHNGSIAVVSEPGQGAVFTIRF